MVSPSTHHFISILLSLATILIHGSPISNESKDAKIVGGRPVPNDQFSWEISVGLGKNQDATAAERQKRPALYKESTHHCDGILLSSTWVMTAGHCGVNAVTHQPYTAKDLVVGFRSKDLDQVYDHGRLPVAEVIVKPGHIHGVSTSKNDITLLRLAQPMVAADAAAAATATASAAFACLPKPNTAMVHYDGTLTSIGFGNVHALYYSIPGNQIVAGIQPSRYLKEIDVMDITNQAGTNSHARYCQGRSDLICITAVKDPESTCEGDSGGSLIYKGELVIGITSFGDTKMYDTSRTVTCVGDTAYTRLAAHTSWIQSYVRDVCLK